MKSSHSAATPRELRSLHQHLHQTGLLFSRMVLVPALQSELNQNGFSKPKVLSGLLEGALNLPIESLRFTVPSQKEDEGVELWTFGEDGLGRRNLSVEAELYKELCRKALRIDNLDEPAWIEMKLLIHQFYEGTPKSLLSVPMDYRGSTVAAIHLAADEPEAYHDNDMFLAQMVGQVLAGAMTLLRFQNKLQYSQTQLDNLHTHYSALKENAQQEKTRLQELCGELKTRAWRNQEKCADLQRELKQLRKELARLNRSPDQIVERLGEEDPSHIFPEDDPADRPRIAPQPNDPRPIDDDGDVDAILASVSSRSTSEPSMPDESMASFEAGLLLREISKAPPQAEAPHIEQGDAERKVEQGDSSAILQAFPTFEDELESFWDQGDDDPLELPIPQAPPEDLKQKPDPAAAQETSGPLEPKPAVDIDALRLSEAKTEMFNISEVVSVESLLGSNDLLPAAQEPEAVQEPEAIEASHQLDSGDTLIESSSLDPHEALPTEEFSEPPEQLEARRASLLDGPVIEYQKPAAAPPPLPIPPSYTGLPMTAEESGELSIQDLEVERRIASMRSQSLLYFSKEPLLPSLSFLELLQELDFEFKATQSTEQLVESSLTSPPTAIALLDLPQDRNKSSVYRTLHATPSTRSLPIFDVQQAKISMRWGIHESPALEESFWRDWLNEIRHNRSTDSVLSIGFADEQTCAPLFHFFCGGEFHVRNYENPVDGIQSLYQTPPQLLALKLGEDSLDSWHRLFGELSQSVRTREVPLLLLTEQPLESRLKEVLEPFSRIELTPRSKLA